MTNSEVRNDFVHDPVPQEARRAWWRIFVVWVGFIIVAGIMSIGGNMAGGMSFGNLATTVLLGNAALGCLAALSGYVAAKSGKSFAQLCADIFPGWSGRIVLLYAPITLIAWYAIECAIFGSLLGQMFHLSPLATQVLMAASAAAFCITTYLGIRGMQWLSFGLVPAVIVLGGYVIFYLVTTHTGHFAFGPKPIGVNEALGLVVGSWALGVVAAYPDLARFAKTPATGAWMGFLGILIFNSLNFFIGAAGAALSGQYSPALILLSVGTPILAVVMVIGNIWTTNDANLYSASLGISRATPLPRRPVVLVSAAIAVCIAFFNPAQFDVFSTFLFTMSATAPALGGVVFGGYFFSGRQPHAIAGWIGWIAGSLVGHFLTGVLAVPLAFATGFVVWFLIDRMLLGSMKTATSPT
jgi:cytosine permease